MARAGRWKSIGAVILCVHCSLTFFAVVGAALLGGAALPTLLGVRADYIVAPLAMVGAFAGWLWWGKRSAEACEVPAQRDG